MVSHDRYLINKLADRLYVLGKDGAKLYPGNYDYYLEKRQEEAEAAPREEAAPQGKFVQAAKRAGERAAEKAHGPYPGGGADRGERQGAGRPWRRSWSSPEVAADYQAVTQTSQEIAALEARERPLLQQWTQLSEELEALEEAARELDS